MAFLGKTGLILSASMLLAGGILFSIGAANGGTEQVRAMAENGELSIGGLFYPSRHAHTNSRECLTMDVAVMEGNKIEEDIPWENEVSQVLFCTEEQANGSFTYNVEDEEWWEYGGIELAKKEEIQKLQIEWSTNLNIYLIEGDSFIIEGDWNFSSGVSPYEVKEDTIKISSKKSNLVGECILYIPEDWVGKEIELSIGAGSIYTEALHANKIEINVGSGYMEGESIIADQLDAEVSSGTLNINTLQVKDAEIEIGLGIADIMNGTITGNLDVECGMGALMLHLTGEESDHNYKVSSTGSLNIGNYNHSGFHSDYEINNHVSSDFEIKCGLGSVDIYFE